MSDLLLTNPPFIQYSNNSCFKQVCHLTIWKSRILWNLNIYSKGEVQPNSKCFEVVLFMALVLPARLQTMKIINNNSHKWQGYKLCFNSPQKFRRKNICHISLLGDFLEIFDTRRHFIKKNILQVRDLGFWNPITRGRQSDISESYKQFVQRGGGGGGGGRVWLL